MSTERNPGGLSLAKKVFSFVLGTFLILYPLVRPPEKYELFHLVIILMGGVLTGIPGAAEVLARFGVGGTGSSSPPAPPASPPQVSPSPSSSVPEGK